MVCGSITARMTQSCQRIVLRCRRRFRPNRRAARCQDGRREAVRMTRIFARASSHSIGAWSTTVSATHREDQGRLLLGRSCWDDSGRRPPAADGPGADPAARARDGALDIPVGGGYWTRLRSSPPVPRAPQRPLLRKGPRVRSVQTCPNRRFRRSAMRRSTTWTPSIQPIPTTSVQRNSTLTCRTAACGNSRDLAWSPLPC